jgi:predicted RNA binding protein YcfA (HicA-like mRNA interferase family)
MGQKFPKVLKYRKVFKAFKKAGFKKVSQSGSHIKLKKKINEKEKTIIIPRYPELDKDLILLILKEAEITKEEFMKLLK